MVVTMARFADEIERVYLSMDAGNTMIRSVRRVLKLLVEVGVHTTLELDGNAVRRVEEALPRRGDHYRFDHLRTLRAICNHGVDLGLLAAAPPLPEIPHPPDIPAVGRISIPTVDQMDAYLKYLRDLAEESWEGHRGFALVATIVFAGLLRNEVMELKVEDIDLVEGTIRIRRREVLKKGWLRSSIAGQNPVKIPAKLRSILESWLPEAGPNFLFPGKRGAGSWKTGSKPNEAHGWIKASGRAAGLSTELNFEVLHRFHVANVVPEISGIAPLTPVCTREAGDRRRDVGRLEPPHDLDIEEATRLMAELRRESGTPRGHRAYLEAGLALLAGLRRQELAVLGVEDLALDRSPAIIFVGGRGILLGGDASELCRQWLARPDWPEGEFASGLILGTRGISDAKANRLGHRLARAGEAAGIRGRVTLESLRQLWRRRGGRVELGDAWRAVAGLPPAGDLSRVRLPATRSDLATWDPPVPSVRIGHPHEPVQVRDAEGREHDMGDIAEGAYEALRILLGAFPERVSTPAMNEAFGGGKGWRSALIRLRDADPRWRHAISFPDDAPAEGGYAIRDVGAQRAKSGENARQQEPGHGPH